MPPCETGHPGKGEELKMGQAAGWPGCVIKNRLPKVRFPGGGRYQLGGHRGNISGKNNLTAGRQFVKLAHIDDALHLGTKVVHGQVEHIHGGLAGV